MTGTPDLTRRRILLGVSGGIAAYKAALVARLLVAAGAIVDPVLTRGAERFVGAATFEGITSRPVRTEVWSDIADETHVALGRAADVAVVYPATAHTLAKLAGGFADDLLTTTLLASTCPLVLAPAMHRQMWEHPATRHNVATLVARGAELVGPDEGELMGGDHGIGRVADPQVVVARVHRLLAGRGDLTGRVVVVTAGGTREPIDPVRYLGNRSSGRMGFALAEAAAARGAQVELVAAPTHLETPASVTRHDVTTAVQMRDAVLALAKHADVVIKSAAVADFRPVSVSDSKLKKDAGIPQLVLEPNPDILAELGAAREGTSPLLVGFAAETDDVEANGRAKLERKQVDLLVVNDVGAADAGFGTETNAVVVLTRDGERIEVPLASKRVVADRVLDEVANRLPQPDTGDG